jgi:hypothetical protein
MDTISMTVLAQTLIEEGVAAELWHTGGGVYCVYAGEKDAEGRFKIIAGPGHDNGEDIVFDSEVYVARDDEDETLLADLSEDGTLRKVIDTIKEALR